MGDEPFTRLHTTSSQNSKRSMPPHQVAYAAERARILFGSYRRGDANDPDTYVMAVASVLSNYETTLIREVTDPNTGIQITERFATFMPNAGELKRYCDDVAARRANIQRLGSLPQPDFQRARLTGPMPGPAHRANVFVAGTHPRFQSFVEWAAANPETDSYYGESSKERGLWVTSEAVDHVYQRRRRIDASVLPTPRAPACGEISQSDEA
jgi:hypothetical protein